MEEPAPSPAFTSVASYHDPGSLCSPGKQLPCLAGDQDPWMQLVAWGGGQQQRRPCLHQPRRPPLRRRQRCVSTP